MSAYFRDAHKCASACLSVFLQADWQCQAASPVCCEFCLRPDALDHVCFPAGLCRHLIAVSTREVFPGLIKLSYASTAAISWTQKPMPDAAIVAISGLQFDGIIEALPFVGVVITEVIAQETPVKTRNRLQSSRPEFSR